jgi:selenium-binding protein 1
MPDTTDPTFYRSPGEAMTAPPERLAYVAAFDPAGRAKDAMAVIDCDPGSASYGQVVGWSELPTAGNELHHFGWNACSSALCHQGHDHHGGHSGPLERRYLIVPGIRSSRTYVLDTQPDPLAPTVVREIPAEELAAKAGYSRPHTVHCGPGAIFLSALGGADGNDGPGGVALLDHDTFDVIGAWELDRGDQYFAYDVWWHLDYDTVITSEWATPSMFEQGLNPEDLLGRRFGHHLNFWSMSERRLTQRIDLGDTHQIVLELRPAHDPAKAWGFVGTTISVEDLSASVFLWHQDGDRWAADKVVTIPAEPADPDQLPPALKPFGAVPPLITDIDLSVDDRWLYVSCWGTGELKQYDVSDPFHPRETGSVRLGGIVRRQPRPAAPDQPLGGGPQMVEVSRDGRRVYVTNSLYAAWDDIFYPNGVGAWLAKLDTNPDNGGGLSVDPRFFPHGDDFRGLRVHQTRLQGGDASSDSYCYTS